MITIKFPDNTEKQYQEGITPLEIIRDKFRDLEKLAIAAKINHNFFDLKRPIQGDSEFKVITFEDAEGKHVFWHTTSHILAHAVKTLYPEAKLAIGPAIEEGFYYDFDRQQPFTPEDIVKIEKEMRKIIGKNLPVDRIELSKGDAIKKNKELDETYRLEIIEEIKDEKIPFYKQGEFIDMCTGPHLIATGKVGGFKLLKVSGAYWRGNAENKQLQRIYGISFPDEKRLKEYIHLREEAEKRP